MPCCLSKGPLKDGFLDIYLNIFLGARISRNTHLRGSCFFGKCLKFNIDFKNAKKKKKMEKMFFVFQRIVSEFFALNSL